MVDSQAETFYQLPDAFDREGQNIKIFTKEANKQDLPSFVKFDRLTKQFLFNPSKKDFLTQEKYLIEVSLVDSFGASTSYVYTLRLYTLSDFNSNVSKSYIFDIAIKKISRFQEATLKLINLSIDPLL
jgi:hypothetical protein